MDAFTQRDAQSALLLSRCLHCVTSISNVQVPGYHLLCNRMVLSPVLHKRVHCHLPSLSATLIQRTI